MLVPFDQVANGFVDGDRIEDVYLAKGSLEGTPLGLAYVEEVFGYMAGRTNFSFHDNPEYTGKMWYCSYHQIIREGASGWETDPGIRKYRGGEAWRDVNIVLERL